MFITLEGGEGVGKTTQLHALAAEIIARGHTVVTTREPGGTPGAERIRTLVMTGNDGQWSATSEALLFAAARADHVERIIRPAIDRGDWVICDRFIDSTRAYQGGAGGLTDQAVMMLHTVSTGQLMPDRTFVLTLPASEARARITLRGDARGDRFDAKDWCYHQKVVQAFELLSRGEPARVRLIAATGTAAEVTGRLINDLADLL